MKTKSKTTNGPAAASRPRAAESGHPEVQRLVAQHQAAVMNGDEAARKAVDSRIRELGFTL